MYYSRNEMGFFETSIHGAAIPHDAVEITPAQHAALLEGQSQGKRIVADENGYPVLQDPPPLTLDQQADDALANDENAFAFVEGITTEVGPRQAGTEDEARGRAWIMAVLLCPPASALSVTRSSCEASTLTAPPADAACIGRPVCTTSRCPEESVSASGSADAFRTHGE